MKMIEIDDELYKYIAGQTRDIGEDASSILRRLLVTQPEVKPIKTGSKINNQVQKLTTFSSIYKLIDSDDFKKEKKSVTRFLSILSLLYQWDSHRFSLAAASLHGSKRRYFATSDNALGEYGRNTKPKVINGTPYWVITNNNTERKCHIIKSIMSTMLFPQPVVEDVIQNFVTKKEASS